MGRTSLLWGIPLFSVDDHVIESHDLWETRVPARWRDAAPRLVSTADDEYWTFEGERIKTIGLEAAAGKPLDQFTMEPVRYAEMRPGYYDPKARLEDMDVDGVWAQVNFPSSLTRICGTRFLLAKDKELALACVRAYNDWIIEEWCAAAPDRYVPVVVLPLWDPTLAAAEVRRTAEMGAKAISASEAPHLLGFPSIHDPHWNPLWQAITDVDLPVCLHIGSSGQSLQPTPGGPMSPSVALMPLNAMMAAMELLFSPIFARYPGLRFVLSEGGIGWVPYVLDRAEYTWNRHRFWTHEQDAGNPLDIFRRHLSVCFIDDPTGIDNRDRIGVDSIMWEGDYPHTDTTWPHSRPRLEKELEGCTADEVAKIAYQNAERVFAFPVRQPSAAPA
jgi:predicted TIM-barrel fold metal-dependent hydrolase